MALNLMTFKKLIQIDLDKFLSLNNAVIKLGNATSCQLPATIMSVEVTLRLQVSGCSQACWQVDKWLLLNGEECKCKRKVWQDSGRCKVVHKVWGRCVDVCKRGVERFWNNMSV